MNNNGNNNGNGNRNLKEFICSPIGKAGLIIALYAILLSMTLLVVPMFNSDIVMIIWLALFVCFGWKSLNKITPDIFLIMPIGGWLIYYVVKFALSFIIGIFIAPFVIAKKITVMIQESIR